MKLGRIAIGVGLACALLAGNANASVTIGGTRVVYPLDQREVTVKLENDSATPSLVQVWIDDGHPDAKPGEIKVPFVITPPIFRMDPKKSQTLRVIYSGEAVPTDRESVYWLNVLDIPPKADNKEGANTLQLAYRTRIKVFVRPPKLSGKPEEAPAQLSWKVTAAPDGKGEALSVSNPTPYYVSFSEVDVESGGHTYKNERGGMVAPHATEVMPVAQMNAVAAGAKIHYTAISDYGGAMAGDATLGR
ncbi:fimbria/pilus periplasmic chaperone [Paraburkholderia phenazinium]|jgi:chaperone protein EcpD|uniref:Chaperone protein EcpD n=1 Tax=Paraburkholderia phenazinium TaxID=60549 RepID=A0A1G7QDM9_9BURK|nr:fimbria/pilus periplasmic chaperone [Paraburkholderia phenazinium]SDF96604.1 chaperone protein EcpD [Paraburkholderia phenazinium]